MKKIILLFTIVYSSHVYANEVNIPDANFKKALINQGFDKNKDSKIQVKEVHELTNLDVSASEIEDLTGIENFKSLTTLNCSMNSIKTLNLNSNTKLLELLCFQNKLTNLEISNCQSLVLFQAADNLLFKIDLSKNVNLETVDLNTNKLHSIDISASPKLHQLNIKGNNISYLDLSANQNLKILDCSKNFALKSVCVYGLYTGFYKDNYVMWQCSRIEGYEMKEVVNPNNQQSKN